MRMYLAGVGSLLRYLPEKIVSELRYANCLESFYSLRKNNKAKSFIGEPGSLMLDSGAFTFLSNSYKGTVDWNKYIEEYADFINRYDVELFFELDIDSIVGLQEVEKLRFKLETLTSKKPIPVWHISRGKEYFVKMCKEYPYVALGGIVTKEIPRQVYEKAFPWLIQTAHKYGAKIHGLGYTPIVNLKKYHFDSVDSTTWLSGSQYGEIHLFRDGGISKARAADVGKGRMKVSSNDANVHNFKEWVKLQKYALHNL